MCVHKGQCTPLCHKLLVHPWVHWGAMGVTAVRVPGRGLKACELLGMLRELVVHEDVSNSLGVSHLRVCVTGSKWVAVCRGCGCV